MKNLENDLYSFANISTYIPNNTKIEKMPPPIMDPNLEGIDEEGYLEEDINKWEKERIDNDKKRKITLQDMLYLQGL